MRRTPIRIGLLSLLIISASAGAERLTVVDEFGQPIAGATVLLGFDDGQVQTTDADGVADVAVDDKAELPLTISAPGFVSATIATAGAGLGSIQLRKTDPPVPLEIKGTTNGYGRLISDGKVDFGLVIPALSREDMISFDVSSIVSSQTDSISIIGNEVKIPSNLTLPEQRETFIFPITLNKPDYRMYVRKAGRYTIGATHGQFPLQRVVNDIRGGKSFFEVINYFDFKEGGQRELDVQTNLAGADLPVNQIPFDKTYSVQAPTFDASVTMLSLGLLDQNGLFLPTDVKHLNSGQELALKTSGAAGTIANLSILLESGVTPTTWLRDWFSPLMNLLAPPTPTFSAQDFNRLSFAFSDAASGGVRPMFLPLIAKPALNGRVMTFTPPAAPVGLTPYAMYLTFSEIEQIENGNVKIERRTRLWDVWSDKWLSRLELPTITWTRRPDRTYRWDVLFLAQPVNFKSSAAPGTRVDLKSITHATRNSLDI